MPAVLAALLICAGAGAQSPNGNGAAAKASESRSGEKLLTFKVKGMTCQGCASGLQDALSKLKNVRGAKVDFSTKTATVRGDAALAQDVVLAVFKKGNYEAVAIRSPGAARAGALTKPGSDAVCLSIQIEGMTCEGCAEGLQGALAKLTGVRDVKVSFADKTATLCGTKALTLAAALAAIEKRGYAAGESRAPVAKPLTAEEKKRADVRLISVGKAVKLRRHLARGKYTIVDYYSEACGPCKILGPRLERLALASESIALRQVDIVDWTSAAAKQAIREFRIPGLPYVRVYDPRGKFVGAVQGNDFDAIEKLIETK